jgi:predicted signal transduction protein with EAL and GGDEF domain
LVVRVAEARRRRERDGRDIGLVFLDLDGFKTVNDEHALRELYRAIRPGGQLRFLEHVAARRQGAAAATAHR